MYNRILVPIDLSEEGFADQVVKHAAKVCDPGGTLILLTVVAGYQMPMVGSFFPEGAFNKAMKAVKTQLQNFVQEQLGDTGLNIELEVKEGSRADTILRQAQKHQAELIVMASHKQAGLEQALLGSVANKVVNLSPLPVLVVKG